MRFPYFEIPNLNYLNEKKAIIVSGYFNPIHKGHLEYFQNAKTHADYLFVIVNSDYQRELKGSNVSRRRRKNDNCK